MKNRVANLILCAFLRKYFNASLFLINFQNRIKCQGVSNTLSSFVKMFFSCSTVDIISNFYLKRPLLSNETNGSLSEKIHGFWRVLAYIFKIDGRFASRFRDSPSLVTFHAFECKQRSNKDNFLL